MLQLHDAFVHKAALHNHSFFQHDCRYAFDAFMVLMFYSERDGHLARESTAIGQREKEDGMRGQKRVGWPAI